MNNETILVVDDNHQIANLLAGNLLPRLGYETLVAYDGKTALEIIRKHQFYISLMLLDLQLPDYNGLELLRLLANEGYSVPTVLITAHGSEQVAADAFRLGVQDYLIKPVDHDHLSRVVGRVLTEGRLRQEKARLTAQLKEQVSWLTVLSNVGQSVTSTLELDEVLRRIVEGGVYLTHAEEGFLALLDNQTGQLYLRAVKNIDQDRSKTLRLPVTDTMVGTVLQSGRPLRMTRSTEGPALKVSTGFLVHSLLHVPLISKGKPFGVLTVDNRSTPQPFKEIDETMLTSLADYAAVAIENASLYQQAQQEIAERKRVEDALRESEERYVLAVRGANDGLWDWDLKTNQMYYSPRWKSMLGYKEDEIGNSPNEWFSRVHPEDIEKTKLDTSAHIKGVTSHFENEHRMLHKDSTYRWMLNRGLAVWDANGVANRMAGSQTDITERKVAEQRLLYDAFHDALTGLPNRTLLMDHLRFAVERAKRREGYLYALLFMDLDRFKDVNDSLGHMMGDQLLIETAKMLAGNLRPTDTVARLGGDEFVVLLEDINNISDATTLADRIQRTLSTSIQLTGHPVYITASIGIVLSVTGYQQPEDVLRDADIAMYRAKALGKDRYEIFDPAMRDRIMERLKLENELRRAIDRRELDVFYQPIVSLKTGRIIGLESLVRWHHPERGLVLPREFIPLAEETGLIIPLDRYVLREACRQMHEWHAQMPTEPPLTVSVNMSGKQFTQPDLIESIELILKDTSLEPLSLNVEITESTIMVDHEYTANVLSKLQALGVQVQIDDFGVGYSSLSYLSRFPLNALKVDRTFIKLMTEDSNYLKIVQAIVMMTHGLGMGVIAEGVETEKQLIQLNALGCEYVQGYLLAVPLDSQKVKELLVKTVTGENILARFQINAP